MTIEVFKAKAPWIMKLLMEDFDFGLYDAAADLGNAGAESGGLTNFQEDNPSVPGSAGGFGWYQWTGPRRREFEAYCARNGLNKYSDEANYNFHFVEMKTTESHTVPAVKAKVTLYDKVVAFERAYERAGVKNYAARYDYAKIAVDAYNAAPKPIPLPAWARPEATPPPPPPPPPPLPPFPPPLKPDPKPIPIPPDVELPDEAPPSFWRRLNRWLSRQ